MCFSSFIFFHQPIGLKDIEEVSGSGNVFIENKDFHRSVAEVYLSLVFFKQFIVNLLSFFCYKKTYLRKLVMTHPKLW